MIFKPDRWKRMMNSQKIGYDGGVLLQSICPFELRPLLSRRTLVCFTFNFVWRIFLCSCFPEREASLKIVVGLPATLEIPYCIDDW